MTDNMEISPQNSDQDDSDDEKRRSRGRREHLINLPSHRRRTKSEVDHDHYQMINDRIVEDITLDFMYKPRTLTILSFFCAVLVYLAFRNDTNADDNLYQGLLGALSLFLVVSALAFPNGPFIRPHPIVWRTIFGLSVAYMVLLQFCLFLTYDQIKAMLVYFDPVGLSAEKLVEKEYAVNCSDLSWARVWSHMDIFAVGHFLGWAMKALLIRHNNICWLISCAWEFTEVIFTHLLPNFEECWWDAIGLDIFLCNGLGIFVGLRISNFLSMKSFHWESIKDIKSTRGKVRRAVLQFTPESWSQNNWTDVYAIKRTFAVFLFVMIWLITELNTFFLKHIFVIDTSHPVVFWRIILIALISAPSIRQYYAFATDPRVKRLGMQCWVYCAVCALEAAICIKVGRDQFQPAKLLLIAAWIFFMFAMTFATILLSVKWAERNKDLTKKVEVEGTERRAYIDSSCENLGMLDDEVKERRRQLGVDSKKKL
ncbi:unnamed protein product, partial [Mesorhabditis belari]|uniref:Phosphatidylserine synthase n=1 Tax=Mesorhabditis belari TaxID=2138241 RepID=A0AAF3E8I2_9BILA